MQFNSVMANCIQLFLMLQKIYILNKCFYLKLSINQSILKKVSWLIDKPIDNNLYYIILYIIIFYIISNWVPIIIDNWAANIKWFLQIQLCNTGINYILFYFFIYFFGGDFLGIMILGIYIILYYIIF